MRRPVRDSDATFADVQAQPDNETDAAGSAPSSRPALGAPRIRSDDRWSSMPAGPRALTPAASDPPGAHWRQGPVSREPSCEVADEHSRRTDRHRCSDGCDLGLPPPRGDLSAIPGRSTRGSFGGGHRAHLDVDAGGRAQESEAEVTDHGRLGRLAGPSYPLLLSSRCDGTTVRVSHPHADHQRLVAHGLSPPLGCVAPRGARVQDRICAGMPARAGPHPRRWRR